MKWFNTLFIGIVCALSFALVHAVEPPTPEPPAWDKSSLKIEGECDDFEPVFKITNVGAGMSGDSAWYLVNKNGGASTCESDVSAGYVISNTFVLSQGMEFFVQIDSVEYAPPFRMCVAQRPGHPGVGWASATVEPSCLKPTAIDEDEEPASVSKLYLPELRGN